MTRISAALAAIALPTLLVLGGCGLIPDAGIPGVNPDDTIEDIVEGGAGGGVDVETGELPANFPSEIPLVEGEVLVGFAVPGDSGESYQVTIQVPDQAAADQAGPLLVDAGFSQAPIGYTNGEYLVVVTSQDNPDGGVAVAYIVTPAN